MKTDTTKYKPRLREYIQKKGIPIESADADRITCITHDDKKPSCIVYEKILYCPVCDTKIDVFEYAGLLNNLSTFPEKLKEVQQTLGETPDTYTLPKTKQKKKEPAKIKPLSESEARKIFTKKKFLEMSKFVGKGDPAKGYGDKITGAWPYKNESGQVEIIDVRFEGGPKKKAVITFYYDGNHVKGKQYPIKIYNRDLISKYPDHTILIVEGCKTAKAAECLIDFGFIPVTWNGGTAKILFADWSCVNNRNVVFFPDDDKPGIKAAHQFMDEKGALINDCKIIPPYPAAREIKKSGADIVEVLQLLKPDKLAEYIKNNEIEIKEENLGASDSLPASQYRETGRSEFPDAPFRILGIAEDNKAYFTDRAGRLYDSKLDALGKNKLQVLAPLAYWNHVCQTRKITNDDWMQVIDDLIELSGHLDFSLDDIRGRGAWREPDGRICFHDGQKTTGEYDERRVFLKKKKIKIGINTGKLEQSKIDNMKNACFDLSFETVSDAMRLLAWCILAPYSGSLLWRPQAFLTGPSKAGKSSVENYIVKPLAIPHRMNGGGTTAAGYSQARHYDSGGVMIEEMDADTEKKKMAKNDLLSIMRESTSDDTPPSYKGTADQTGKTYVTRDMFFFIAINPEVETVADDNRMTKINMVMPPSGGKSWMAIKKNLINNFTPENCEKLRGMVWDNIQNIITTADRVSNIIQDHTGKDHRFAISEGTLMATYLIIWKGNINPTDKDITDFVAKNYDMKKPEDDRDDTGEIIDRLLEYKVKVYLDKMKEFNVLECLTVLKTGRLMTGKAEDMGGKSEISVQQYQEFKRSLNNIGITADPDGNMAIANNHNEIKRITGRSNGYSRILKRHHDCIDHNRVVSFLDKPRRCTVIENIIFETEDDDLPF